MSERAHTDRSLLFLQVYSCMCNRLRGFLWFFSWLGKINCCVNKDDTCTLLIQLRSWRKCGKFALTLHQYPSQEVVVSHDGQLVETVETFKCRGTVCDRELTFSENTKHFQEMLSAPRMRRKQSILEDSSHPLFHHFELISKGRHYRASLATKNVLQKYVLSAVNIPNDVNCFGL